MLTILALIIGIILTLIAVVLDICVIAIVGPIGAVLFIPIIIGWILGANHAKKH
jgi:hypothetical protein